ncbi:SRPBCC family protein [Fulvivirgaceae bacterium BMA10]|uniref:SRPBCC family protein n=1 Tax=Splendidivirga corallicola TaxID=3051826 RepID=A0ABT8KXF1_9BACT|nr:SRPBCC family protein [Fulvivirgaceae bacterium BMA10]
MNTVTIESTVNQGIQKVWVFWTTPEHITNWNFATPDWHCPSAEHDLKVGGKLKYHMAARDGSMAFDYAGTFTNIQSEALLEYTLDDGRKVSIKFNEKDGATQVLESFEAENQNPLERQRQGWQAILDNFKKYVESN